MMSMHPIVRQRADEALEGSGVQLAMGGFLVTLLNPERIVTSALSGDSAVVGLAPRSHSMMPMAQCLRAAHE